MTISSSSQTIYPQKLVINGDTVVAISPFQLRGINRLLIERKIYKESVTEIQAKMVVLNKDILKAYKLNEDKTKLIDLQEQQIKDLNTLNVNSEKNIALMKSEISNQKRKKFRSTVVGVATTALVTATVVSMIK